MEQFKKIVRWGYQRYLIDAMGAMALGLFASLLVGLIVSTISEIPGLSILNHLANVGITLDSKLTADLAKLGLDEAVTSRILTMLVNIGKDAAVGAAIGMAIAWGLKSKPLAMFTCAAVGAIGYRLGGPLGCYFAAVFGAEAGNLVAGRTKVDIVVIPLTTLIIGGLVGVVTGPWVMALMNALKDFIASATLMMPIPMGLILAVVVGLVLTAPISSAALCAMLFTPAAGEVLPDALQLAAGAATVGCCAQMVGFAVASWKENRWNGLVAQGLGTSMLQVPNIMRHPAILIPPTLTAAILGPLSTTVLVIRNAGAAAGMGTSGLVGQIGTWKTMIPDHDPWILLIKILVMQIILPAILTILISYGMRKMGWIKDGDMRLEL